MTEPTTLAIAPGRGIEKLLRPFAGKRVVLAGCGGGCDVFGAVLPFTMLKEMDPATQIVLANLSFTDVSRLSMAGSRVGGGGSYFFKIQPGVELRKAEEYFPEARLATALSVPVYAIAKDSKIAGIAAGYCELFATEFGGESPDLFCLVDGGCDAILTGSETGLATPVEDMLHLRAVNDALPGAWQTRQEGVISAVKRRLGLSAAPSSDDTAAAAIPHPVASRFILCVGMDVDCGHGVVYEELLVRIHNAAKSLSLVAQQTLELDSTPAACVYRDTVKACHPIHTIVQSLVVAALEGHRGAVMPAAIAERTGPHCAFSVSELTCTMFAFGMERVASEVTYLRDIPLSGGSGCVQRAVGNRRRS